MAVGTLSVYYLCIAVYVLDMHYVRIVHFQCVVRTYCVGMLYPYWVCVCVCVWRWEGVGFSRVSQVLTIIQESGVRRAAQWEVP